jgi:hypothetical protein
LVRRQSGVGGRALVPALPETIAVAVHLEDVNVVGETVEQGSGEALGAEDLQDELKALNERYLSPHYRGLS